MTINKTEEFLYFQNKAKHYDTIKNMKSSVNDKLEKRYMKTLSLSQKPGQEKSLQKKKPRLIPIMREIQIKEENEHLINRLVKLFKSQRTEVNVQGNYSRYNHEERKFRSTNPYKVQMNRTIEIGNNEFQQRLKRVRPKVGTSTEWERHFGQTLSLKKNMSKYLLESNKSKASLHISVVDNYVPKYFETFLNTSSVIDLNKKENNSVPKEIQITHEGLFILPDIKSKESHPSHMIRHTKDNRKLIFDRSKSSLHDSTNKSQISLDFSNKRQNPQNTANKNGDKTERKQKRRLLEFKFAEISPYQNKPKTRLIKKDKQLKASEVQSTLKYQSDQSKQLPKDSSINDNSEQKVIEKTRQEKQQHLLS